ncbi:MAG: poly-beta-1,6-N-acetyl-D-glucosamine synthase, partial [Cytophagales bacterium]
ETWREYFHQKVRHLSVGKRYKFSDKLLLGLFSLSWMAIWLLVFPLAWFHPLGHWLVGTLVIRWVAIAYLFHRASARLGQPFETWKVPFLDFIYSFYYLVAGVAALKAKRIRWKN